MFEKNESINVFNLQRDLIVIKLGSISVKTTDGNIYKNVYAICRLLSISEIRRIDNIKNDTPVVHDALEFSIVSECLVDFIGVSKDIIDFDNSDAGLVPRIANAVIIKSLAVLNDPVSKVASLEEEVSLVEMMGAIVARHMNLSYIEVLDLPINKLLRYFSICKKTFPQEITLGAAQESM